jgi:hypothetical protein
MAPFTRRMVLAAAAGAFASPALAQPAPVQPAPASYASVTVDIRPLLARGAGPEAFFLRDVMQEELRLLYAGRIGGRGPRLVVRLQTVQFTGSPGGGAQFRGTDYLDGELLVVGARGEVLQAVPQLLALPPSGSSTVETLTSDRLRLINLAQTYARWVPRRI